MDTKVLAFMEQLREIGKNSLFDEKLDELTEEEKQELKRIYLETSSDLQIVDKILTNVHERVNSNYESSQKLEEQIRNTFDYLPASKQCNIVNDFYQTNKKAETNWVTYPIDHFNMFCQKEMKGDFVHVCECLQDDFHDIEPHFFMWDKDRDEIFLNTDIWQSIDDEFDFLEYLVKHQEILKD